MTKALPSPVPETIEEAVGLWFVSNSIEQAAESQKIWLGAEIASHVGSIVGRQVAYTKFLDRFSLTDDTEVIYPNSNLEQHNGLPILDLCGIVKQIEYQSWPHQSVLAASTVVVEFAYDGSEAFATITDVDGKTRTEKIWPPVDDVGTDENSLLQQTLQNPELDESQAV